MILDDINSYQDYDAISQSGLKKLLEGPKEYVKNTNVDSNALRLGTVIDELVTQHEDDYSFIVYDKEGLKPTGQMLALLNFVIDKLKVDGEYFDLVKSLEEGYNVVGFKRDSFDKILTRWEKESSDYFNYHLEAKQDNKFLVDKDTYELACILAMKIQSNEKISDLIRGTKGKDVYKQLAIYWEHPNYTGIKLKSLLDFVVIDHKNKTILPIDLKTSSFKYRAFIGQARKLRYDIQAAFYTDAIKFSKQFESLGHYRILPFKFLYLYTGDVTEDPVLFDVTENFIKVGRNGGNNKVSKEYVKGYIDLLEDYCFYSKSGNWDKHRDLVENENLELDYSYLEAIEDTPISIYEVNK